MSSKRPSEPLDLERGLPTTPADVEALRRARSLTRLSPEAYLRFLAQFPPPDEAALRARRGPRGEPFKL